MPGRENRREQILTTAIALFCQQGYQATSVRQIAETVGCTEAALYYHFKGGKRELFQEAIAAMTPDVELLIAELQKATSLRDLFQRYGQQVKAIQGGQLHQTLRWLVSEMPRLTSDERDVLYRSLLNAHERIAAVANRFVDDQTQANEIAWLLLCASFGFRQLFVDMELNKLVQQDVVQVRSFSHIHGRQARAKVQTGIRLTVSSQISVEKMHNIGSFA